MLLRPEAGISKMVFFATGSKEVRVLIVSLQSRLFELPVVIATDHFDFVQPLVRATEPTTSRKQPSELS
jgi:hypothetical protein